MSELSYYLLGVVSPFIIFGVCAVVVWTWDVLREVWYGRLLQREYMNFKLEVERLRAEADGRSPRNWKDLERDLRMMKGATV